MTKAELRKIYKKKRTEVTVQQSIKWSDLILINFQQIERPIIECVHTYIAAGNLNEIDTENIIEYLKFTTPGLKICVPKIDVETGRLTHFIYADEIEMVINEFGIAEPLQGENVNETDIDLVIIPLLAFDKNGYRVGYGKGFYDKFLQNCKPGIVKIGLSFFEPEDTIDDINQFDIPLNFCVTPQKVYSFKR